MARSVGAQAVDDVVVEIEAQIHERAEKEISSEEPGRIVMEHLQRLAVAAVEVFEFPARARAAVV